MATLALSRHLSFHAHGDAAFVWHGLTGDVAEMSRDVVALLLAFEKGAEEKTVAQNPPAGLSKDQVEEFVPTLRARRFLVLQGLDEISPLLNGIPRIPRATVFERGAKVRVYTRAGTALELDEETSQAFLRCDGERTLGAALGENALQRAEKLLRLAKADVAALKILAKPVSQGGVQLNPAAESTMPYPEIPDAAKYAAGGPAPEEPRVEKTALSSLFGDRHPALRNRTFTQAVADELERRGAFKDVKSPRVLSIGLDLPGATNDLTKLTEPDSLNAIVANELMPKLGFSEGKNAGAIAFVRDAAKALAPSGVLLVIDFGDPKADATPASIKFADLQAEATQRGLGARVVPLSEALDMDLNVQALSATKASWPALVALFKAHGIALTQRAWLRTEIEALAGQHGMDLSAVHGLTWAPLSERALSLSPRQFWALVAQKPERVLH